jgi:hypothetical protein
MGKLTQDSVKAFLNAKKLNKYNPCQFQKAIAILEAFKNSSNYNNNNK